MDHREVTRMFELDWMACDSGDPELGSIDADYLVVNAKGDLEHLRRLVPAPLVATEDVTIYMGYFKETVKDGRTSWAWPFHEWGIGVRAQLQDDPSVEGLFLVQLYVDDDLVMAHGREVWGYPKKYGQLQITPQTSEDSSRYEYTVARRGTQLISGSVEDLEPIDKDQFPFFGTKYPICFRQVPAPDRTAIEQQQLVFVQVDFEASGTMRGTGSINIEDGPFDQIPIGPLTDLVGYFGRCTFNHHDLAARVVDATELARPVDTARAGKTAAAV
jgi:acetoacetate decarboxylase